MSDIPTLATLVLGGAFDATELGENDIQPDMKLIEELQQRLVTGTDDVYVELINRAELDRVTAENAALQQRLNAADQRIDELERDKHRLDALESNCWDVRFDSSPNGDAGDSSINIEVVGHWMDQPFERVIGENYSENLRAAIDQAMAAPAYPPARPEYPEPEPEADDEWNASHPVAQPIRDQLPATTNMIDTLQPERIKGMIEARGSKFAIMIDEANAHYGWTFKKDPNGMWVSGRKATDAEMHAARTYARTTDQQ
ncbi:hypothetical protein [Pseudomonas sp. VE 196-7]|uniref:hypothetical protein n=1 Tax=Pseudomonas sp. VE 196-7 TaxID=2956726 RepID=UPI0021D4893F|nr:hypothetical protein [Pseudomonas sp. VE 196-7]MCU7218438.1 hypothetical protein [Pseudomonas sp. VE 196-7]